MDAIDTYFAQIRRILDEVLTTQKEKMCLAAEKICEATEKDHNLFAFGCNHAGLVALDLYYRSGGMATINPLRAPGLNLDIDPAEMTSKMERLPEYGKVIIDYSPLSEGDVIFIHSVSGRNPVVVDAAMEARRKGAYVIALTSLSTASSQQSRHPSGKSLYQTADLVIDNCGCPGDGALQLEGMPERFAPTSTAIGSAVMNAIVARAVQYMLERGIMPPVFVSANLDGGEEHNRKIMEKYRSHIFYGATVNQ